MDQLIVVQMTTLEEFVMSREHLGNVMHGCPPQPQYKCKIMTLVLAH